MTHDIDCQSSADEAAEIRASKMNEALKAVKAAMLALTSA